MRSAPIARYAATGQPFSISGDLNYFLATPAETGGRYLAIHATVTPGGGPPPHTHTREDETFIVLEGEMTFIVEGREIKAGPGTLVDAPRHQKHTFTNTGSTPASMIVIITPGHLEGMFKELGTPLAPGQPPIPFTAADAARFLEVCPRYGITIHIPGSRGG